MPLPRPRNPRARLPSCRRQRARPAAFIPLPRRVHAPPAPAHVRGGSPRRPAYALARAEALAQQHARPIARGPPRSPQPRVP
jgi:hypothetical protein